MRRTLQTLSHSFAAGAAAAAAFAAAAGAFHVFHPACFLSAGFFVGGPSNTDGRLLFAELPLGFAAALLGLGGGAAVLLCCVVLWVVPFVSCFAALVLQVLFPSPLLSPSFLSSPLLCLLVLPPKRSSDAPV